MPSFQFVHLFSSMRFCPHILVLPLKMPLLRNSHSNSDQQEGYPKKAHGSTAPTWPTGYYFVTMLTCWGGGGGWGSPLLQNAGNAEVETAMLTCVCVGGGGLASQALRKIHRRKLQNTTGIIRRFEHGKRNETAHNHSGVCFSEGHKKGLKFAIILTFIPQNFRSYNVS